jgi:hypothetical protein
MENRSGSLNQGFLTTVVFVSEVIFISFGQGIEMNCTFIPLPEGVILGLPCF